MEGEPPSEEMKKERGADRGERMQPQTINLLKS